MKEDWTYKRLGDIGRIITGNTPSTKDVDNYSSNDFCFVKPSDISKDGITTIYNSEFYVSEKGYGLSRQIPKGSVLTTCIGIIGKVGILSVDAACNQQINAIVPSSGISSEYLALAIYSSRNKLEQMANAPVVPIINKNDFSNLLIPVPSLPEQERIVAELDSLTVIIDKQKAQLKELDTLAQSIFYDMFGNPVENEKGWEVKKLKESVNEMFLGPFGSALKTDSYVPKENSFCMVYEQKHAIRKSMNVETHYINRNKFDALKRFEVHSGDFIMSCRGTIGEIFRLPENAPRGIIHPSLMKIRIKEDIYAPNFFLWLLSIIIRNENTNGNCVQMAITANELGTRTPIVPSLSLQQSFASKIESIETQKSTINRSIAETQKLFDYTMDKYFG